MTTMDTGRRGRRALRLGSLITAVTAAAVLTAAPVSADVEREQRGQCSGSSRWELSLEKEFGRIDADLEIDTTRTGRAWRVRMHHDGTRFVNMRRVTDREDEIDLDRQRRDRAGRDRIQFRAVDTVNGEVCRGSLSI